VFQHQLIPPVQVAGQEAAKLLAAPKPIESPVVSTKSQTAVPVSTPVINPSQVNKQKDAILLRGLTWPSTQQSVSK
jgi:hypothetical protein